VEIPDKIQEINVISIGKKAFLSCKHLKKIILPSTITEVGDWAFAYCDALENVRLLSENATFGKAVFLECSALKRIEIASRPDFCAPLLAFAAVTEGYYLLDGNEAGSSEWLAKWDQRMYSIMTSDDAEGYSKQILCGEEDYGSTDMEAYKSGSRKKKIRMAFIRLLYPDGLSYDNKKLLEDYILSHTKGCESDESWQIIRDEHGSDREYYELFASLDCVSMENISGILEDIGGDYPEMKAFFIRYKDEHDSGSSFFDELEL
jgi:hypothetical protein